MTPTREESSGSIAWDERDAGLGPSEMDSRVERRGGEDRRMGLQGNTDGPIGRESSGRHRCCRAR